MAVMEAVTTNKVAGFVDSSFTNRKNRQRIEQEEKELQDLLEAKEPEVQEEVDDAPKEEAEPLNREEASFKKRYGDLRRHMQEKEKEWETKFNNLQAQLASTTSTLPNSEEDIEAWVNQHPDVAAIVQALAAKEADKRVQNAEQRLQQLDQDRYEITRQKAEQTIIKAHPDFNELKESDAFHDWADEQPKWVQDAIYENADDPRSVIRVIDLYKADKGLTKSDKKKQDREAASMIKANSRTRIEEDETESYYSESQVSKMGLVEYEKHQDKILEAMRTGKFKYDISGAAR